jgi:FMN-dependent oxidoreductase (nitrilotriacetate monooxygenase family)
MPAASRFLRLNAVIFGLGNHEAAWRAPESDAYGSTSLAHWIRLAQIAEAAGFDSLFLGDVLALLQGANKHLSDTMDPIVILSAIAAVTSRIGLIGTASTSFDSPFHLARRFASLDHISNGRAGWNIVTSSNILEARNFGIDALPDHAERYARAAEVVEAVVALWDSWGDDARVANKAEGIYLDGAKLHAVNYEGRFVRTAGPLNTPRPPQGHPVLVQAGSSEDGRALAASRADVVFTAHTTIESAIAFRHDIKQRARAAGRDPDQVLIMPGIMPVVAATRREAQARLDAINGAIVHDHAIAQLSEYLQLDARTFDLDAPLPAEIGNENTSEANQSRFALIIDLARREQLTVRQLLQRVGGGRGHFLQAGTPSDIADTMQQWFEAGAADGFNVMCPVLPGDLQSFSDLVMPELVSRGLRPSDKCPGTLRQVYGLSNVAS